LWAVATAHVNGIDLAYTDSAGDDSAQSDGAGAAHELSSDAPVLVLGHGFLLDQTMFDGQRAALAPEFRVITLDARGFGATLAPGPFSYWDLARDVLALLDHLGIETAVLGGVSQGGFVGLRAALLAPDRVRGLTLIDTQAGLENPALAEQYEQLEVAWMASGPEPVQDLVASIIIGAADWAPWQARWAAYDTDQLRLAFRCLMDRDDVTGRLAEITCPAVVLHGTRDDAIPIERGEELRAGLAGPAELVRIEGGSHAPNLTEPDQVNRALLAFLRSLA
jgi:3-oxoadipate enol-lactonase